MNIFAQEIFLCKKIWEIQKLFKIQFNSFYESTQISYKKFKTNFFIQKLIYNNQF